MKLKPFNKFFGFTLAELMIVLTILGVIAAVLVPTVFESMPDENKLKFKKGYYTLQRVIDGMVNSDAYEATGGQFGKTYGHSETALTEAEYPYSASTDDSDGTGSTYFCMQFSDMLNGLDTQCSTFSITTGERATVFDASNLQVSGGIIDTKCPANTTAEPATANVVTQDGIYWFLPKEHFTYRKSATFAAGTTNPGDPLIVTSGEGASATSRTYSKIPAYYAVVCMDVDGPGGEAPFAFGVRIDGKVVAGYRAKQWLKEGATTSSSDDD